MKALRWFGVVLLGGFAFVGCHLERASVGENQTFCSNDDECTEEKPFCDNDISICRQCYQDADCGGAEPDCRLNVCLCETDEDCFGKLSCLDGECTWVE